MCVVMVGCYQEALGVQAPCHVAVRSCSPSRIRTARCAQTRLAVVRRPGWQLCLCECVNDLVHSSVVPLSSKLWQGALSDGSCISTVPRIRSWFGAGGVMSAACHAPQKPLHKHTFLQRTTLAQSGRNRRHGRTSFISSRSS